MTKYRIVKLEGGYYLPQVYIECIFKDNYVWSPLGLTDFNTSIDTAKRIIQEHKSPPVIHDEVVYEEE